MLQQYIVFNTVSYQSVGHGPIERWGLVIFSQSTLVEEIYKKQYYYNTNIYIYTTTSIEAFRFYNI